MVLGQIQNRLIQGGSPVNPDSKLTKFYSVPTPLYCTPLKGDLDHVSDMQHCKYVDRFLKPNSLRNVVAIDTSDFHRVACAAAAVPPQGEGR